MSKSLESMISDALIRNGYTSQGEKLPVCPACGSTEWNRDAEYTETQHLSQATGAWETDYAECHEDNVTCAKCEKSFYQLEEVTDCDIDALSDSFSDLNTSPSDALVQEWVDWFAELPEDKLAHYLRGLYEVLPEYLTDPAERNRYAGISNE